MPTTNRTLYEKGQGYRALVSTRRVSEDPVKIAATRAGVGVKEVRTAYRFAGHVNKITETVPGSLGLILDDGHPHLTPKTVAEIARRTSRGIEQAMRQASAGLHPFATTLPADLPEEHGPWHHDLTALRDAKILLDRVLMGSGRRMNSATLTSLAVHLTAICALLDSLQPILRGRRRKLSTCPTRLKSRTDAEVDKWVDRARQRIESVVVNLPRMARSGVPRASVRKCLAQAVKATLSVAETIRSRLPTSIHPVRPPTIERTPQVSPKEKGTYVVLFRVKQNGIVIFGRSDSFLVRAGYVLYVGSAFGSGGVRSRSQRHLEGTGPRVWGIDDLRGFASPIGLWWTHHGDKVECIWARALAGMPDYCCPAPLAGATDCNDKKKPGFSEPARQRCPAHFFHTHRYPSVERFAEQLGLSGSGGYTVHFKTVGSTRSG